MIVLRYSPLPVFPSVLLVVLLLRLQVLLLGLLLFGRHARRRSTRGYIVKQRRRTRVARATARTVRGRPVAERTLIRRGPQRCA